MPLEHLAVCRHGAYKDVIGEPALNDAGRKQAEKLGNALGTRLEGRQRAVITSISLRARQTAAIIAEILGVTPEELEELWNDSSHRGDLRVCTERIDAHEAPAIVVVTHLEYTAHLPNAYRAQLLGAAAPAMGELSYGQAWYLHAAQKTAEHIR